MQAGGSCWNWKKGNMKVFSSKVFMLQKEGKKKDGDKDSNKEDEDSGKWSSRWMNKWSFRLFKIHTKICLWKLNPL